MQSLPLSSEEEDLASEEALEDLHEVEPAPLTLVEELVRFPSLGDGLVGMLFRPACASGLPAMILCHGALEFKENYFELGRALAARGVVALALDMHGHGASEGPRYHVDMEEWVADIRAALDYLCGHAAVAPGRVGVFGWSSGGTAALEAALADPRIHALALLDATVHSPLPFYEVWALKLLAWLGSVKRRFTHDDLRVSIVTTIRRSVITVDPEAQQRMLADPRALDAWSSVPFPGAREGFFVDTIDRVDHVAVPTLVMHGAEDRLDPPDTARMLFKALSCERQLYIIPESGHAGHLDRRRREIFDLTAEWALRHLR